MTDSQISKNDFFTQFTVKLCSSLDIKKAAYQCSLLIKEIIPFEVIDLTLISEEPGKLKRMLNIRPDSNIDIEESLSVTDQAWDNMQKHFKINKVLLMYKPENLEYARSLIDYASGIIESYDMAMPLVYNKKPLGFFAIRSKTEFSEEQVELITSIKEPITHAVAASLRFEGEYKKQKQHVDVIFNRIKLLYNINTDKKLAQKLNINPSNIANCKMRNSIPYDKIIQYCQNGTTSLDMVFMHGPFVMTKKTKDGLHKAVLTDGIKNLNQAEVEDILKLPKDSLSIYLELCANITSVIPPIEKLSENTLQTFQNALLSKQMGQPPIPKCVQRNIPMASGTISKNRTVKMSGRYLYFCNKWTEKLSFSDGIFAYEIADDTMEPTLLRDDVTLINPKDKQPKSGGLYAIHLHGNLALRRLMPSENNTFTTICDNKVYPITTVGEDDIIGKVVWYARTL